MTQRVKGVLPDCAICEAAKMLVKMKISCLPILDDQKNLRGIMTAADFMRVLLPAFGLSINENSQFGTDKFPYYQCVGST